MSNGNDQNVLEHRNGSDQIENVQFKRNLRIRKKDILIPNDINEKESKNVDKLTKRRNEKNGQVAHYKS